MGFLRSLIRHRRLRLLVSSLGLAVFAGAIAYTFAAQTPLGAELEGKLVDTRFELRGERPAPDDIVLLAIDDESDTRLGQRFPYRRDVHADVVRNLRDAGARTIVLDVQFLGNSDASDAGMVAADREFIEALHEVSRDVPVVIATDLKVGSAFSYVPMPFEDLVVGDPEIDADPFAFSGASTGTASFTATASDAVLRAMRPRRDESTQFGQRRLPTLSLAAIAASEGRSHDSWRDLPELFYLNFYGGAGHFRYLPYWHAAQGAETVSGAGSEVAGRIVLVGATSAALQDLHEVPMRSASSELGESMATGAGPGSKATAAQLMPGVEIHATALANMRDGSWLTPPPASQPLLLSLLMLLVVWVLVMVITPTVGVPLALVTMAGFWLLVVDLFERGTLVAAFAPLLTGAVVFITAVTVLAISAVRDRSRVRSLFSRYVSPEVVRQLMETEDTIELGGERREVSVLFSDIRGFTSLSEEIDPSELVGQLNDYFAEMVDAVELEQGMLDKFIGDGMMAIFGAPLEQPDHAERAVRVALDMQERLERLNREREAAGLEPLGMGIGIHSGVAVVGNVGSPRRRVDFTAIGDTVNLAARLEAATKNLGVALVVSEVTARMAAGAFQFGQIGSIVVKGRRQATEVFYVEGPAGELPGARAGGGPDECSSAPDARAPGDDPAGPPVDDEEVAA